MESVTNQCFRKICKDYGADILVSEFISSEALIREVTNSGRKMEFTDYERILGTDLYAVPYISQKENSEIKEESSENNNPNNESKPIER